jgi:threonine synthase
LPAADHVLCVPLGNETDLGTEEEHNPFIRFRKQSIIYSRALAAGLSDARYCELVRELNDAVARVDRRGFEVTPLFRADALGVWVKDETSNVSGSHKGRHLFATALHLKIQEELGRSDMQDAPLAIASCGNAALAAAVIARAAERELAVFVSSSAPEATLVGLEKLGAQLTVCERGAGQGEGDPCYLAFVRAVEQGAIPFSCQGGDNALALVGGYTLGLELIAAREDFDVIAVQVGGGVLASSLFQAYRWAREVGVVGRLPRLVAVQTESAHPLYRAWTSFLDRPDPGYAATHRSEFMRAWPEEPRSIASGILDDETYDWLAIVEACHASGGEVVTVSDEVIADSRELAQRETGIDVSATGIAGWAGIRDLQRNEPRLKIATVFTGVSR